VLTANLAQQAGAGITDAFFWAAVIAMSIFIGVVICRACSSGRA